MPTHGSHHSAIKDTHIPLLKPVRLNNGEMTNSIFIKKGTSIFIGIATANRSEDVWGPDAKEFKPERWLNNDTPVADKDARLPGVWSSVYVYTSRRSFALLKSPLCLA